MDIERHRSRSKSGGRKISPRNQDRPLKGIYKGERRDETENFEEAEYPESATRVVEHKNGIAMSFDTQEFQRGQESPERDAKARISALQRAPLPEPHLRGPMPDSVRGSIPDSVRPPMPESLRSQAPYHPPGLELADPVIYGNKVMGLEELFNRDMELARRKDLEHKQELREAHLKPRLKNMSELYELSERKANALVSLMQEREVQLENHYSLQVERELEAQRALHDRQLEDLHTHYARMLRDRQVETVVTARDETKREREGLELKLQSLLEKKEMEVRTLSEELHRQNIELTNMRVELARGSEADQRARIAADDLRRLQDGSSQELRQLREELRLKNEEVVDLRVQVARGLGDDIRRDDFKLLQGELIHKNSQIVDLRVSLARAEEELNRKNADINVLRKEHEVLESSRGVRKRELPYLGLEIDGKRGDEPGMRILNVEGPAEAGGLRPYDLVHQITLPVPIRDEDDFARALDKVDAGDKVHFAVLRNGEQKMMLITAGYRNANANANGPFQTAQNPPPRTVVDSSTPRVAPVSPFRPPPESSRTDQTSIIGSPPSVRYDDQYHSDSVHMHKVYRQPPVRDEELSPNYIQLPGPPSPSPSHIEFHQAHPSPSPASKLPAFEMGLEDAGSRVQFEHGHPDDKFFGGSYEELACED